MLQGIRDGARGWLAWVIVIIICVPFAFWGINEYFSPSPKRVIAEVNGVELSEYDFKREVAQQKRQFYARFPNMDLSFMNQQIRQSTLTQMIEEEVLVQSVHDVGMRISDALLAAYIHNITAFQIDGVFSQQQYEQALSYQSMTPTSFEWTIRRMLLTNQIRQGVLRSALLTDYDQQQRTRLEKQQRFVSYLIVPASKFNESVIISEAEIDVYYKEHAKQYMTAEQVSIEYVELSQAKIANTQSIDEETLKQRYEERKTSFTTTGQWKARHILIEVGENATAVEEEDASQKAEELLTKIRAGDSFEDLAKQFSDDVGSGKMGGDLGWFEAGMMVKPFEDGVKALKVGEISELVKSQFGFHIIKLEDVKPDVVRTFDEVRAELEEELQKEFADSEFYGQVEEFANLAYEHPNTLDVLADTLNLESKTSELFDRRGNSETGSINPILRHRKVIEAAFSDTVLKDGYNSELVEIGEQHVVVLRLKDHVAAEAKPLADVEAEIVASIMAEKTQEQAKNLGKSLLDEIKENGDPNTPVKEANLNWTSAQWIERQDSTLGQPAIVSEVFKMGKSAEENKAVYLGLKLDNGDYALVAVLEVKDGVATTPDTAAATEEENLDDPVQQAKQQQQQAFGQSDFNQLVSGMKAKADIKDYSAKL